MACDITGRSRRMRSIYLRSPVGGDTYSQLEAAQAAPAA